MTPGTVTDAEVIRFNKRIPMFMRHRIDQGKAEAMAWAALDRDADKDDRRYCVECRHLQQDGGCFMHKRGLIANVDRFFVPIKDVLQRCSQFAWAVPQ